MKKMSCAWLPVGVMMLLVGSSAGVFAQESWSLDDALRQVDTATRGIKGITAAVEVTRMTGASEDQTESGEAKISLTGALRFEVSGDAPRTILCKGNDLFIFHPDEKRVDMYSLSRHPEKLAPYALVGFEPAGTELSRSFLLTLLREESLDGRKVVVLELTPKDEKTRAAVSKIHLWIDQSNWLPIEQRIFQGASNSQLTLRYSDVVRNDSLGTETFAPRWPKGTEKVRK